MAKLQRQVGTTNQVIFVEILSSSSTAGGGLTGLAYNTAGLTCYYMRNTASADVQVTLATMTLGTWATGGFVQIDATNMPGLYAFSVPNAALASGADNVVFIFRGASGMVDCRVEIELTATNNQDGIRGGMTALPNAAAAASGGLPTIGTGAGQIEPDGSGNVLVTKVNGVTPPTNWNLESIDSSGRVLLQPTQTGVTIPTVTTLTNLPSIPNNWLTASGIASGALDGKGDWLTVSGYTAPDNSGITSILSLLGTPEGATISDNIATIISDVSALPSATGIASSVMSSTIETGYTLTQILRLVSAVLLGQSSGVSSGSPVYRDVNNTTNRVSATASEGNRSAVTLNAQ